MPRSPELSADMRIQSRRQLLTAARQLFAAQGYFNTSVKEITTAAGMSTGNLYWHFENKEHLLKAVLADGFAALVGMTAEVAQHPGSPQAQIEQLIERSLALYDEQRHFTTVLLAQMAHGGPEHMARLGFDLGSIGAQLHANLLPVFTAAIEAELITNLDPNVHIMHYFGLINGLMLTYAEDWIAVPPEIFRAAVLRLFGLKERP